MHPTVYLTPEDVMRAKENIQKYAWAKAHSQAILREADSWLAKPDAWLRDVVPGKGACFAYGFTGCPRCGAKWGTWYSARASWDAPGKVTCTNGHTLPDAEHPDPGTGYRGKDGRIHYFVGSYNAWVVEMLTLRAADSLVHAYTLTGDERYAAKAALILDAIAAIYPSCDKGSWDYPSDPPSGRLNRPWYQVARVLIHYTNEYDQIAGSKALDTPSATAGLTKRRNIEENLLKNGAAYCYEQSRKGALHNGTADYIRGALAVGICLDIPEYVRWAVDGPYGIHSLLENNIDRDGQYYETSASYADHTRDLYLSFAEPLRNYRGSAYPGGVDLYKHPKFRRFLWLHNLSLNSAGHLPRYGDSAPDVTRIDAAEPPFNKSDYRYLERLYARTEDPQERRGLAALLRRLAGGDVDKLRGGASGSVEWIGGGFTDLRWLLFHARDVADADGPLPADAARRLTDSALFGQKGMAILRSDTDSVPQALLLRYGPSLNHGHLDDLNINFFSHGYELTYDLGYALGSTHTQVGWAKQTASHNLVLVDETSQGEKSGGSGGSLHLFADLPGVKLVEASSEASYSAHGVTLYRRTLALIDGCLVDLFRVRGGKQHDYVFHTRGETAEIRGVALGPEEPGSLAGPDISWGDKQLNDGDLAGHANKPYWNPPPGNGLGFLVRPRRGRTDTPWSADWPIDEDTRLRLLLPAEAGAEVITASAPGIYPHLPKLRYVLSRRKGEDLSSQFAAVIEPYSKRPSVTGVETLALRGPASAVPALALRVGRGNGTDVLYSSADTLSRQAGVLTFAGKFVHARAQGDALVSLSLVGAARFEGFGWRVQPQTHGWTGTVSAVDYAGSVLTTKAPLPTDGSLDGKILVVSSPRYGRTTAYRIVRAEAAGDVSRIHLDGTLVLGKGQVGKVQDARTVTSVIPHEYAHSVRRRGDSGFFTGKRVQSVGRARTNVNGVAYGAPMTLTVESTQGLNAGDVFHYYDVQEGDRFEIAATLSLRRAPSGEFSLHSDVPVEVTPPAGVRIVRDH